MNDLLCWSLVFFQLSSLLYPTDYIIVESGQNCNWVTTKEECEEAARELAALGELTDTTAYIHDWAHYPPACTIRSDGQHLDFDTDISATGICGVEDRHCICKNQGNYTFKRPPR